MRRNITSKRENETKGGGKRGERNTKGERERNYDAWDMPSVSNRHKSAARGKVLTDTSGSTTEERSNASSHNTSRI